MRNMWRCKVELMVRLVDDKELLKYNTPWVQSNADYAYIMGGTNTVSISWDGVEGQKFHSFFSRSRSYHVFNLRIFIKELPIDYHRASLKIQVDGLPAS